jgi:hypothetical protein
MNLEENIKMMYLHRIELSIAVVVLSVVINLLLRFKWTRKTIEAIIDDTLKVNDGPVRRFSGTKITMMVAFSSVVWGFHYITIKEGFNEIAFITMSCIATGVAITGAYSKKINPPTETTEEKPKE